MEWNIQTSQNVILLSNIACSNEGHKCPSAGYKLVNLHSVIQAPWPFLNYSLTEVPNYWIGGKYTAVTIYVNIICLNVQM